MKKRIISMLLLVAMAISMLPSTILRTNAASTSQPIISVEEVLAASGSTVELDVKISENPGILGATLTLSWAEGLTLINAEEGDIFTGLTYQEPSRYESVGTNFIWYGTKLKTVQDGTVLKLTFQVAENVAEASKLAINISGSGITDTDKNAVTAIFVDGCVQIVNYTPGDVDDSGEIDPLDLIILAKYISDGCKTDPDGYNVTPNVKASDVNDDGEYTPLDLILISQYISDGCKTDPDGYNVVLKPSTPKCDHSLEEIPYKAATCEENGNARYWYCTRCDKYFGRDGTEEIEDLAQVILPAMGHTVVIDPAVAPTYSAPGLTEGSHCGNCGKVFKEQEVLDPIDGYAVTYNIAGADEYLAQQSIDNAKNPTEYNPEQETITLYPLEAPDGYEFLGWYDAPKSVGGKRVTEIKKGSTGAIELYAHWKELPYDVTYKLYQTPLGAITEERFLHYTVSKGLKNLPNPEINNYIFLGWYMDDGTEVTEIPIGTTGDITLNAYWTSKRNLAKAVKTLEDPIILEDSDNGIIYFTYEIGTIENVPLHDDAIWTIQSVAGLAQQKSETVSITISTEYAKEIAETISKTTVDSATWTLSKDWNEVTEVSKEWAEENGMTQEEANTRAKSESGTYSVTDSNGGSSTTTTTDGTTTLSYDSQNKTHGNGAEFNAKIHANYTAEVHAGAKIEGIVDVGGSSKFEIGGEIGGSYEQHQETDEHTGTDTTKVDSTVTSGGTSWNKATTSSTTKEASESETVSKAISSIISNTFGYGKSYSSGGENSTSQDFSTTDSKSASTSSTLTYFTSETRTTTTTYSTDGKSEGCYRLVLAGTVHVFAVVGYDVATQSYFTYTINVLDDKTYEFLDYSPDLGFDDYENSVLPFEIPYYVHEYVMAKTVSTEGLQFRTNSATGTAQLIGFVNDTETDVIVPSYISSGGTAYKVTSMSANAFAGRSIEAVVLSDYIDEIPAGAFKNCTSLKQISGCFTKIGDEAFSGCTSLENFTVSPRTTSIGRDAFKNVPSVKVKVFNADVAMTKAKMDKPTATEAEQNQYAKENTQKYVDDVVAAGAQNLILDISGMMDDVALTIEVNGMSSFELLGGKKTYKDLRVKSSAATTTLREMTIMECSRIPLEISSENLVLEVVNIESQGYSLLLSANNPSITLIRDNSFTAKSGDAVVTKVPAIISEVVDKAVGTLLIKGNVYVNGTTEAIDQLKQCAYLSVESGQIIPLSNELYDQYIQGIITLLFDANGGEVAIDKKNVFCGTKVDTLPVPSRTGYEFMGWFKENGEQVTSDSILSEAGEVKLYAHWTAMAYNVNWNTGAGYTIAVNRTESPYAGASIGALKSGAEVFYGDKLSITYAANTGYTITSQGSTSITVTENVTTSQIYASASVNSYTVSWDAGNNCSIAVKRTSSPLKGAATGNLNSGDKIYHGDVLSVTYTANNGYHLSSQGSTAITVSGNVTKDQIKATASPNDYTYNIVYKSSNGTNLGSTTVTYKYGTTNTITPPAKSGYDTPSAQSVTWDSTSAKTITFTYSPSYVATSQHLTSGTWWQANSPGTGITYSVSAEYRNRTANSVEVRIVWTQTITAAAYGYNQYFYCSMWNNGTNRGNTGNVKIASTSTWPYYGENGPWHWGSVTAYSAWITIPLDSTGSHGIEIACDWWREGGGQSGSWAGKMIYVPAY